MPHAKNDYKVDFEPYFHMLPAEAAFYIWQWALFLSLNISQLNFYIIICFLLWGLIVFHTLVSSKVIIIHK